MRTRLDAKLTRRATVRRQPQAGWRQVRKHVCIGSTANSWGSPSSTGSVNTCPSAANELWPTRRRRRRRTSCPRWQGLPAGLRPRGPWQMRALGHAAVADREGQRAVGRAVILLITAPGRISALCWRKTGHLTICAVCTGSAALCPKHKHSILPGATLDSIISSCQLSC